MLYNLRVDLCESESKSLKVGLEEANIDSEKVVTNLRELMKYEKNIEDWSVVSDEQVIEFILQRYHDVFRRQLSELIGLARRVELVHTNHDDCPVGLSVQLERIYENINKHMDDEEQVLFPLILKGIEGDREGLVYKLRKEQEDYRQALLVVDRLTCGFTLPNNACNTWEALYQGIDCFERDFVKHLYFETEVLFKRIKQKSK